MGKYYRISQFSDSRYRIYDPLGVHMDLFIGKEKALLFDTGYGLIAAIRFAFSYFGAILGVVMLIVCFLFDIDKHMDQVHASLEAKMK